MVHITLCPPLPPATLPLDPLRKSVFDAGVGLSHPLWLKVIQSDPPSHIICTWSPLRKGIYYAGMVLQHHVWQVQKGLTAWTRLEPLSMNPSFALGAPII